MDAAVNIDLGLQLLDQFCTETFAFLLDNTGGAATALAAVLALTDCALSFVVAFGCCLLSALSIVLAVTAVEFAVTIAGLVMTAPKLGVVVVEVAVVVVELAGMIQSVMQTTVALHFLLTRS